MIPNDYVNIMFSLCLQKDGFCRHHVPFRNIPLFEKRKKKKKVKKRIDISDKYDIRNCPFHLNYWTKCLIEDHLITVYDNDIFLFNQMFDEASDIDSDLFRKCFRYTRDYCCRNKDNIYRMFSFFRAAFYENLRKMDGYEERMEKWYEEIEACLGAVRDDSEDQ